MLNLLKLSNDANAPKYKQIVNTVQNAVEKGVLKQGDLMPSLNQIRDELKVSRDTAIKAYQELKMLGLLSSSPGRGNFITVTAQKRERHIFLLFDEFRNYKEVLYNSLKSALCSDCVIDLYFHHFNETVFYDLIQQSLGKYTDYVIMPFSLPESLSKFQNLFNQENVYILDQGGALYGETFPSVYQKFDEGIYSGLKKAAGLIEKYDQFLMVIGQTNDKYRLAVNHQFHIGFNQFCAEINMDNCIIPSLHEFAIEKGMCFLIHSDLELVRLVKQIKQKKLVPGKDIGIISFNDSPLKEIACDGITTISTDFELMGRTMGEMILNHSQDHIVNPIQFIQRNTL